MQRKKQGLLSRLKRKLKRLGKKLKAIHIPVMNVILLVIGVAIYFFVREMIRLFELYGAVPDTLIVSFFGACGLEGGVMGWIKTSNERKRERKWELEDRKASAETEKAAAQPDTAATDQPRNNL